MSCKACNKYSSSKTKEPVCDRPDLPFQKVAADIFDFGGKAYFVVFRIGLS